MSRINFTKKLLESLPVPETTAVYRDATARGLGVKIEASGHRTFFWSRRARGKLEWKTIGEIGSIDLENARGKANEFNAALTKWRTEGYPGDNPFQRPSALTLGEVIAAYVDGHVRDTASRPDRAVKAVEWQAEKYLSKMKHRKVMTLRRSEILKLRGTVKAAHGVYAANRLIQMLRAALNWSIDEAELWKGPNPATGITLYQEVERERFLHADEMQKLRDALAASETETDLRDFVRLSLMTGMRKNDLVSMRWENVELDRGTALVPKPKNKKPYFALLPEAAVEILKERAERARTLQEKTGVPCPWVFPGTGKLGHLLDPKRGWASLLKRAGITGLRQHDLRRSFAAWQAIGGASMLIISKGLGQKNTGATPIYARLADAPVRASIETAVRAMFAVQPAVPVEPPRLLPAAPVQKRRRRA